VLADLTGLRDQAGSRKSRLPLLDVEPRLCSAPPGALPGSGRHRDGGGAVPWLRATTASGRSYCRGTFRGDEPDVLWIPWLLHAGPSPDHAPGGLTLPAMAATLHGFGMPVVAGGAQHFVRAFQALLDELEVSPRGSRRSGCSSQAAGSWASPPTAKPSGPATPWTSRPLACSSEVIRHAAHNHQVEFRLDEWPAADE
jgi:hypothetical protein